MHDRIPARVMRRSPVITGALYQRRDRIYPMRVTRDLNFFPPASFHLSDAEAAIIHTLIHDASFAGDALNDRVLHTLATAAAVVPEQERLERAVAASFAQSVDRNQREKPKHAKMTLEAYKRWCRRGLDGHVHTMYKADPEPRCTICQYPCTKGQKVFSCDKCNGKYHANWTAEGGRDCLFKWVSGYNASCPTCRKKFRS
jgi:hypothetical protein